MGHVNGSGTDYAFLTDIMPPNQKSQAALFNIPEKSPLFLSQPELLTIRPGFIVFMWIEIESFNIE